DQMINQSPGFIDYFVRKVDAMGLPVVTPGGALGAHIDADSFLPHLPQTEYPAGALVSAFYLISGVRGMERGTISSVCQPDFGDSL
ncbi:MAG: tryptophanase, partial [Spirochaetota bacterium]